LQLLDGGEEELELEERKETLLQHFD